MEDRPRAQKEENSVESIQEACRRTKYSKTKNNFGLAGQYSFGLGGSSRGVEKNKKDWRLAPGCPPLRQWLPN